MSPPTDRKSILQNLRSQIDNGKIIVGAGAGIGLSAKFIEAGGGDLIIIYNSGRYRMAGRGSLAGLMPYGNANDVVLEMVCALHLMLTLKICRKCLVANNLRLVKSFLSSSPRQY
jgi:predicted TIM-barrel enzyme